MKQLLRHLKRYKRNKKQYEVVLNTKFFSDAKQFADILSGKSSVQTKSLIHLKELKWRAPQRKYIVQHFRPVTCPSTRVKPGLFQKDEHLREMLF